MKNQWSVYAKRADFGAIAEKFGIDPVTARIIRNRDIVGDDAIMRYLHGSLADLYDPALLGSAADAARLLLSKIREGKKIRIIGDYDIDGVCAVCILFRELTGQGALADYEIPDRIRDGYGLHRSLIEQARDDGIDTIITCDNGISAIEEIAYAKSLGMTVIVTDHHQCVFSGEGTDRVYQFPPADVIVNPHIPGDPYPEKGLCGAVVAWKVMQLLHGAACPPDAKKRGKAGDCRQNCLAYLELAAIATVGDVMELTGENRIIVKEGLLRLRQTQNKGLHALLERTGLAGKTLSAYHIGYILGPCINASGRLDTAKKALRLILSEDAGEAYELAGELTSLNEQRKELTQRSVNAARSLIEQQTMMDKVLVLYLPDCHESIAGIVAGKVRELYEHPAIILTDAATPGILKGSGRSIEAYSMYDALSECSEYLLQFGGHPMAAGMTLEKEKLDAFRRALNAGCLLSEKDFCRKIMIDVPMPTEYVTPALVQEFSCLEPCGRGNEKPLFAQKNLTVRTIRILGQNRNVMKLSLQSEGGSITEGLYFGDIGKLLTDLSERYGEDTVRALTAGRTAMRSDVTISILYYPQINTFRGYEQVQMVIRDYQLREAS